MCDQLRRRTRVERGGFIGSKGRREGKELGQVVREAVVFQKGKKNMSSADQRRADRGTRDCEMKHERNQKPPPTLKVKELH